jgi:hypothetical protein
MTKTKAPPINFDFKTWGITIENRSNNRMKFRIKLDQEETEAFRNFSDTVKPVEISMDDFIRSIFFAGVRSLEEQLTHNLVQHIEEHRDEYEASGFTFDTSGNLTGVDEEGTLEVVE